MANNKQITVIPDEQVISKIYLIRTQKVMLDRDLAELYQVETRVLNQAVRRNRDRFPKDFMFQLSEKEFENWKLLLSDKSSYCPDLFNQLRIRLTFPFSFVKQGVLIF